MKRALIILFFFLILPGVLIVSCTKANEQQLANDNGGNTCDTTDMKYSTDVVPILESHCYSCHGNGNTGGSGGINLDGYNNLSPWALDGTLAGVITHAPGYTPMPYGLPKLDDCNINKILDWINRGAPND